MSVAGSSLVMATAIVISSCNEHRRQTQGSERRGEDADSLMLDVHGNINRRYRTDEVRRALQAANTQNHVQCIVIPATPAMMVVWTSMKRSTASSLP